MALPPKFKGHRLLFAEASATSLSEGIHTVEIFLDYVCPFSAKMFNTIHTSIAPAIRAHPKLSSRVQFLFRQQIQPWHPSSTLVHEAAVAVLQLAPDKFWDFSAALFKAQREYFDVALVNEKRNDTYRRLAKLGAASAGVDEEAMYKLLEIPEKPAAGTEGNFDGGLNGGNKVTNDLKVVIKMARLVSVHVSPTVIFDGVVAGDISSGWTTEQWIEWLEKSVA